MTNKKYNILIVDDNPTNLSVLVEALEKDGFDTSVAEDGESAIELLEFIEPDIILLDVMMPGIDGFETCRRLKNIPKSKQIPVIFMTARTDLTDKVTGFEVGAVDYVTKPIQYQEVLARLNTHLTIRNLQKVTQSQKMALEIANQQMEADLSFSQKIQQKLLPPPNPTWPGLDIIFYGQPAHKIGGDFYKYHSINNQCFGIAVSDISGHGIPAALVMAVSLSLLNSALPLALSPHKLMAHLEPAMQPYTELTGHNWAMTYVQFYPTAQGWELKVANAGGVPPFTKSHNNKVEWLKAFGTPLGVGLQPPIGYTEVTVPLSIGDMVIITTDGVVEAKNKNDELFGFDRLENAIKSGPQNNARDMLTHLKSNIATFINQTHQQTQNSVTSHLSSPPITDANQIKQLISKIQDDITIVIIQVNGLINAKD